MNPSSRKPNLLFIFTDQQRADTMRCYGNVYLDVAHLNALADGSFVFENAYVSQPVCSPSRATMLCGLYPHTARVPACNVPLPREMRTIAEMVSADYRCCYNGKWHLGDEIFPQHGFGEWVGTEDSYRRHFSSAERHRYRSAYHHFLVANGFEPDAESEGQRVFSRHVEASMPEPFTKAAFQGDRAAQFIRACGDDPFVLAVSYLGAAPAAYRAVQRLLRSGRPSGRPRIPAKATCQCVSPQPRFGRVLHGIRRIRVRPPHG